MLFDFAYNPAEVIEKAGAFDLWNCTTKDCNREAGRTVRSFKEKILVVDDDPDIRQILCDRILALGYQVATAENGIEALEKVTQEGPDLIFLDLQMPQLSGMQVLKKVRERSDLPVVIISAFGTIEKAVEAMKEGAFDFITKPFCPDHIEIVIKKALDCRALKQENIHLKAEVNAPYLEIVGESPRLKETIEIAQRVAVTTSTVLLLGESGTGKEIFARSIHRWSDRSKGPFVAINCVALRDELIESELFGHEKGSFTGAVQMRQGKLEIADGGTVFLDEIGDFKPDLQAKLLRFLQEREFERVGGNKGINVDVRIIAATNRDLNKVIHEGGFREDLFFRLNVVAISLPALRERREDVPALAQFFLRRYCQIVKKPLMKISPEAMDKLIAYHWPGNVRELGNMIERAVVLARGREIMAEDLPLQHFTISSNEDYPCKDYHDAI
ncbi:MAG: sigma-54-dependent Fis family transcriptional regulator, partial [Nitrospirae bacterium]|nr:sigma-54-dependent Fis family transcriptional regulator [Nitrospirota bacterium]